jgi:hypothetical protein
MNTKILLETSFTLAKRFIVQDTSVKEGSTTSIKINMEHKGSYNNLKYSILKSNLLKKNPFLFIVICYLFSNFLLFFNTGMYWDDWTLYNMPFEGIMQQFKGNGAPYFGYIHYYLNKLPNPSLVYSLLTFILQLSTAYCMWLIIKLLKIDTPFFFWVVLLANIVPYFSANNTMICFPYTLAYFIFWLGFLLMLLGFEKKKWELRILSLLLFFASFTVNSFLVFYIIPFSVLYLLEAKVDIQNFKINKRSLAELINFKLIIRKTDFLLLPILFFVVKSLFLKTEGLYADSGYNEITLQGFLTGFVGILKAFDESYIGLLKELIINPFSSSLFIVLFIFFSVILFIIMKKMDSSFMQLKENKIRIVLIFGVILFVLGAFPYAIVGKIPTFNLYETRHQLLLPVGASMITLSLIWILVKPKYLRITNAVLLAALITTNIKHDLYFIKDNMKQESIAINFSFNKNIRDFHTFLLIDYSKRKDELTNSYRFYNLCGISKEIYKKEDKLIVEYNEYKMHETNWKKLISHSIKFNIKDYKIGAPEYFIKIDNGSYTLSDFLTFKMLVYKLFNKDKYSSIIKDVLELETTSVNNVNASFFLNDINK